MTRNLNNYSYYYFLGDFLLDKRGIAIFGIFFTKWNSKRGTFLEFFGSLRSVSVESHPTDD